MRRVARLLAVLGILALPAGCGEGGCLSRGEVEDKVDEIASGAEFSSAEVQAKQSRIADVRSQEC